MKTGVTKREYLKLIRRTETALDKELRKTDAERDEELVRECVESLSYYRSEYAALSRKAGSKAPSFRFARVSLAVVLALVLTFTVGATIAQAAGFRVWTAIFRHDAGYLRVDYVPENTAAPTERAVWEDAEKNFFEYSDFREELLKNGFDAFAEEWNGFTFFEGGVRSTASEYYSSFTMRADDGYIRVRMIAKSAVEGTTSVWGLREGIPAVHISVNGVDAAYQIDGDYAFATWQQGSRIFSVSVYERPECTEALLYAIIN